MTDNGRSTPHELRAATPFRRGEGWTVACATCQWVGGIWAEPDQASAGYVRHWRRHHRDER